MALSTGIVSCYNMNESGTTQPTDYYSVGPSLTMNSGASHAAGLISNCLTTTTTSSASATDNIFSMRVNGGDPDFGVARTFAVWCKATNYNSAPGILSNWANGGPVQWLLFADDTTHITFQVRNKSSVDVGVRLSAPTATNWNLFVCTYDGAGTIGLSINGAAKSTNTITSVINGSGAVEVGNRNGNAAGLTGGNLDIFGVWDHALSDADITLLYNAGAGIEAPFAVAPVAAFSGTPTSLIEGTQVTFTDASTGTPTSWAWAFGSGEGTSTDQNPVHTYNTAGDYTVSLDATNAGGTDNETKTDYIHVEPPVVAAFSADLTSIIAGTLVTFTDASTGTPESWAWAFGSGEGTSTSQNPTHTYNTPGTFTVSLDATKTAPDSTDNETKTNYISVEAPIVADFTASDVTVTVGETVSFTDTSTGTPESWTWTFGTGEGGSSVQNPMHQYNVAGTFTVVLVAAKTSPNSTDTETKTGYITVSEAPPPGGGEEEAAAFPYFLLFLDPEWEDED